MKGKRNRDHSTLRLSFSYNAPGGVRVSNFTRGLSGKH